jgi:hypothetical protein
VGDTPTARALLAANLPGLMDAAIAREPALTRMWLAARMLPRCSPDSAASTVRGYMSLERWPRPEQLDSMAAALGVSVADLLRAE